MHKRPKAWWETLGSEVQEGCGIVHVFANELYGRRPGYMDFDQRQSGLPGAVEIVQKEGGEDGWTRRVEEG